MNYNLITARPEAPISEQWIWLTDLMTAFDGSEASLPLLRYPNRLFSATYTVDGNASLRKLLAALLTQFSNTVALPLFQYLVVLKSPALAGTVTLVVNTERSDFRVGSTVLIAENDTFEVATVSSLTSSSLTLTAAIANPYSKRAIMCPVVDVYSQSGPSIQRSTVDHNASVSFSFTEFAPLTPFVNPMNSESLIQFDSLVVLEELPYGSSFDTVVTTGTQINQFIGLPDILETWLHSTFTYNVAFLCNRVLDVASWNRWIKFAEYCQGSMNSFLMSTQREDFGVVTAVSGGGNQVVVESDVYSGNYWSSQAFKRISIQADAGTHYARVTGISTVGVNDKLTFTPALPAGAGWDINQKISFLLEVRNATDKIVCTHAGLSTDISFSIRTVA